MNVLRISVLGGWRTYRGGARILTPGMFIPMMIITPVLELVFFVYVGRYAGTQSPAFYVIGNGLYSCAGGALFTLVVITSIDRRHRMLELVLASPAPRFAIFAGRMLPAIGVGMCSGLTTLVAGDLVADLRFGARAWAILGLAAFIASVSAASFGLLIGVFGLRNRDANFIGNLVMLACLVLSGANVPLTGYAPSVRLLAEFMPMTLGIDAARRGIQGSAGWAIPLAAEIVLALFYVSAAALLLRVIERGARRTASLELL